MATVDVSTLGQGRRWKVPGRFEDNPDSDTASQHRELLDALDAAVPIYIRELRATPALRRIQQARRDWGALVSAENGWTGGADLMFGGQQTSGEFNVLARVLATLAYQPGGVTFANRHWCTDHTQCRHAAMLAARSRGGPDVG